MERIRCPALLPEDSATPVLTRMLASAPYQAPVREGKEESEKTQDDLGSGGKWTLSLETSTFSRLRTEAEEDPVSLLQAGGKGPPPKIGRGGLPRRARCHRRAAWVWKATLLNSSSKGTSPRLNCK